MTSDKRLRLPDKGVKGAGTLYEIDNFLPFAYTANVSPIKVTGKPRVTGGTP
jgi:hypothetical protein